MDPPLVREDFWNHFDRFCRRLRVPGTRVLPVYARSGGGGSGGAGGADRHHPRRLLELVMFTTASVEFRTIAGR